MREYDILNYVHEWLDTNQAPAPSEPGVYFIYYSSNGPLGYFCELLYIGSSQNLKKRLASHEILRGYHKGVFRITYNTTNEYRDLEKRAIKRFSPLANVVHNNCEE